MSLVAGQVAWLLSTTRAMNHGSSYTECACYFNRASPNNVSLAIGERVAALLLFSLDAQVWAILC